MAKQKKQQPLYTLKFINIGGEDTTLTDVMVKEVDLGDEGYHWAELTRKGNRWLLLKTPGFVFEPTVEDNQVVSFDHSGESVKVTDGYLTTFVLRQYTVLNLKADDRCFWIFDLIPGGCRIQRSRNFSVTPEGTYLNSIVFERQN